MGIRIFLVSLKLNTLNRRNVNMSQNNVPFTKLSKSLTAQFLWVTTWSFVINIFPFCAKKHSFQDQYILSPFCHLHNPHSFLPTLWVLCDTQMSHRTQMSYGKIFHPSFVGDRLGSQPRYVFVRLGVCVT